jgi:hypothetical protein
MNRRKLIQSINKKNLSSDQLTIYLTKDEKNLKEFIDILHSLDNDDFKYVITQIKNIEGELREKFYMKLLISKDLFYPLKEFIIEKLKEEGAENLYESSILLNELNEAEKEHFAFERGLEDKSLSEMHFQKLNEKSIQFITMYLIKYVKDDYFRVKWIFEHYGKWENIDKAILKMLSMLNTKDAAALFNDMPKDKYPKNKLKELKKVMHQIVSSANKRESNLKNTESPIVAYKAWISPILEKKGFMFSKLAILNYITTTQDYVLAYFNIKGKEIVGAHVFQKPIEEKEDFIEEMENQKPFFVECEPSYAQKLLKFFIRGHKKSGKQLPEILEKYSRILIIPVDGKKQHPMDEIYHGRYLLTYIYDEHFKNLFTKSDNVLFSWIMPPKIIRQMMQEAKGKNLGGIIMPGQTQDRPFPGIEEKYMQQFWTPSRRNKFAFNLLHMSYYYHLLGIEIPSIICYYSAKQLKDLQIDIKNIKFAWALLIHSLNYYYVQREIKYVSKRILGPTDKKLIY